jgi:phosphate butyryltransferase
MEPFATLDAIAEAVMRRGTRPVVAIAPCAERFVLRAARLAAERGIAEPFFIGDMERAKAIGEQHGFDLGRFESIHCPDDAAAVETAVRLFKEGRAKLLMKGLVSTAVLLRAALAKDAGIAVPGRILSHVTVFQAPRTPENAAQGPRLMLLTDAGVNIKPNLQRKVELVKNALQVARLLGMREPRVAALAATEKVNYPAMPATLEADMLAKMGQAGDFGDAVLVGPVSLDLAISPEAATRKRFESPLQARADILLAPDIESGNILYKALSTLAQTTLAGVVAGGRVPIVVPSRGDDDASKFASIALAAWLAPLFAEEERADA